MRLTHILVYSVVLTYAAAATATAEFIDAVTDTIADNIANTVAGTVTNTFTDTATAITRAAVTDTVRDAHIATLAHADAQLRRPLFGGLAEEVSGVGCADNKAACASWAADGECEANPGFMKVECRRSCNVCTTASTRVGRQLGSGGPGRAANPPSPSQQCIDEPDAGCRERADHGHCDSHKGEMLLRCPRSCRVCPYWPKLSKAYDCADQHENCRMWALAGECENNPGYMLENCATSCDACERKWSACDRPKETPPLVTAGGINATFLRLLRDFPQYNPQIISRPGGGPRGANSPWVVTLSNFINDTEADSFISSCQGQFNRSLAGDVISPVRTSQQCWCSNNKCEHNPLTRGVADRISAITGAPIRYMEPFQVLRYEVGQFYKTHHDQNSGTFTPQGPRVYTFYMYLSTPEAGGGTRFNDLGVTVPAVKGNAVLWPSVQTQDPLQDEPYTRHESVSVEKGVKYGANIWVHNYDFRTPADKGCLLTHMNTH